MLSPKQLSGLNIFRGKVASITWPAVVHCVERLLIDVHLATLRDGSNAAAYRIQFHGYGIEVLKVDSPVLHTSAAERRHDIVGGKIILTAN